MNFHWKCFQKNLIRSVYTEDKINSKYNYNSKVKFIQNPKTHCLRNKIFRIIKLNIITSLFTISPEALKRIHN